MSYTYCIYNISRTKLIAKTCYKPKLFVRLHQLKACRITRNRLEGLGGQEALPLNSQ